MIQSTSTLAKLLGANANNGELLFTGASANTLQLKGARFFYRPFGLLAGEFETLIPFLGFQPPNEDVDVS